MLWYRRANDMHQKRLSTCSITSENHSEMLDSPVLNPFQSKKYER